MWDEEIEAAIRHAAFGLYVPGWEREDLLQEARAAVFASLPDFDPAKGSKSAFVRLVARRWLVTILIRERRNKHRVLTESVRVARDEFGRLREIIDTIPNADADPARIVEHRDRLRTLGERYADLTELERVAVQAQQQGLSYREIEARFGMNFKSIDNAIQRARAKLARAA